MTGFELPEFRAINTLEYCNDTSLPAIIVTIAPFADFSTERWCFAAFSKRRRFAQTPENPVPFEMNSPGKLIPVGKDNYTPMVLFWGEAGSTVMFAFPGNLEVFYYDTTDMVPLAGNDPDDPNNPGNPNRWYSADDFGLADPRGGVVTLYIQAMTPSEGLGDLVITATLSTQTSGVTPPPDSVRATAYDVVVSWEDGTGANGATLDGNPNGGGDRVFPEQTTPDPSSLKNVVNMVFQTVPENLGYEVPYFYWLFDPDNFIGLGSDGAAANAWTGNDNYGAVSWNAPPKIPANGVLEVPFTIMEAHAGDNWIVVSSASQKRVTDAKMDDSSEFTRYDVISTDTTDEKANRSEMLTVWRTLHAECDVMPYFNFAFGDPLGHPCDITVPPDPAGFLGLAISELAWACVVINPIPLSTMNSPTLNVTQPPIGHKPLEESEYDAVLGWIPNVNSGRDLFGNSKEFWTVRIVMVSKYEGAGGLFESPSNTILICYETIKESFYNWFFNHHTEIYIDNTPLSLDDYIASVTLHEICHVLIDGKDRDVCFDDNGNATDLSGTPIDASTIGVRDTFWRTSTTPFQEDESDVYNQLLYSFLLLHDINEIQQHSRAQD